MPAARSTTIAVHVEAAKRLLDELEQHAATALDALKDSDGDEFLAAVRERDRILGELSEVVQTLAHERLTAQESQSDEDSALLTAMAEAASAALESHEQLVARTQQERDRLAAALARAKKPDAVAHQYAAATVSPRARTISVTG